MAYFLYNFLLLILSPLVYLFLFWRLLKGKESRLFWRERWGYLPENARNEASKQTFWVHAVSVGEVMAALPVLRELRARFPDAKIILSTTTIGGRDVAEKQQSTVDTVISYPFDFPLATKRAMDFAKPDVVILMEWEIWPNFLRAAKYIDAKIVVLNGRISERGLRRGRSARWLLSKTLGFVDSFAMQSDVDGERAKVVGVARSKIVVLGNTKFDEATGLLSNDERMRLRSELGIAEDSPVVVFGSTRPGEETIIAESLCELATRFPNLRAIIAPRHIERADDVERILRGFLLNVTRRSVQKQQTRRTTWSDVLLLDTFGELASVYAVGKAAFVGGSLLPFGGQSVFQPLAQGIPTVFGNYMNNQRDIAALALQNGVGFRVTDSASLTAEIARLLTLPDDVYAELSHKARHLIESNRGVARKGIDIVAELLKDRL